MGNCCSGSNNDLDVNMMRGISQPPQKILEHILDDREVLGLRGEQKIRLIVKLQALLRGALTRKKIKQKHGFQARTFASL